MTNIYFAGAAALLLTLAACGQQPGEPGEQAGAAEGQPSEAPATTYSATGAVTAVSGEKVTISHGPVPDLRWPAMTMTFRASSPRMVGRRLGYVLTSLTKN